MKTVAKTAKKRPKIMTQQMIPLNKTDTIRIISPTTDRIAVKTLNNSITNWANSVFYNFLEKNV